MSSSRSVKTLLMSKVESPLVSSISNSYSHSSEPGASDLPCEAVFRSSAIAGGKVSRRWRLSILCVMPKVSSDVVLRSIISSAAVLLALSSILKPWCPQHRIAQQLAAQEALRSIKVIRLCEFDKPKFFESLLSKVNCKLPSAHESLRFPLTRGQPTRQKREFRMRPRLLRANRAKMRVWG